MPLNKECNKASAQLVNVIASIDGNLIMIRLIFHLSTH